jgi:ferredoxin-NADP reductase
LGKGSLALVIAGVRQLTPRVRAYELRAADGASLPTVTAGAHLDVPVRLAPRTATVESTRRYSIIRVLPAGVGYEIAVQRDDHGGGGSLAVHSDYHVGMTLLCGVPGNDFEPHADSRPAVLIAGGIGVTPMYAMAQALVRQGRAVELHYAARSRRDAALLLPLQATLGDALKFYASDTGDKLNVTAVIAHAAADSVFYVCGPHSLLEAVRTAANDAGVAFDRVRFERFAAAPMQGGDQPVSVTLRRSGKVVEVGKAQSVLDAVQAAGVDAPSACRAGTCGTCAVKVLAGEPDHRDTALTNAERSQAGLMCICVSRAKSSNLTLDL